MRIVSERCAEGQQPRGVVVGAVFGGLTAAKNLAKTPVDVTLIVRENHHVFQPLLYQAATAGLSVAVIAWPIRRLVRRQKNTRVLFGEVTGIDRARKRVILVDREIGYDILVLATDAAHGYFGQRQLGCPRAASEGDRRRNGAPPTIASVVRARPKSDQTNTRTNNAPLSDNGQEAA
jgi:hypothetical protein